MNSYEVTVQTKVLEDTMTYDGADVLTYKIEYPHFGGERYQRQLSFINTEYFRMAERFQREVRRKLYAQAVAWYKEAQENGYPFFPYDAEVVYELTYNKNCTLSLYFDQYTFTGGAHGSTTRVSDTWNIQTARRRSLQSFFPRGIDARQAVLAEVQKQIKQSIDNGEDIYFDDYEKNTEETFKADQFFLKPEGVVVYFQQYDIAPYSTGIPEFTIPFARGMAAAPRCWR